MHLLWAGIFLSICTWSVSGCFIETVRSYRMAVGCKEPGEYSIQSGEAHAKVILANNVLSIISNDMKAFACLGNDDWVQISDDSIVPLPVCLLLVENHVKPEGPWKDIFARFMEVQTPYSTIIMRNGPHVHVKLRAIYLPDVPKVAVKLLFAGMILSFILGQRQ